MELTNKNFEKKKKPTDMSSLVYGKVAPQAPEFEAAVIGAIMLEPYALLEVLAILNTDDFYSDANQRIFNAIQRMHQRAERIDFMTVAEELDKSKEIDLVGGRYAVTKLTQDVVSSAHIVSHARIVKEKSILRQLIRMGGEIISGSYESDSDCFEMLDAAETLMSDIRKGLEQEQMKSIGTEAIEAYDRMKEKAASGKDIPGYETGFKDLDLKMGGLTAPDLTIIAAGPGEGKTSLALNMAGKIAEEHPVAFFSLEMSAEQLVWKFFAGLLEKPINQIRMGKLTKLEWEVLEQGIAIIQQKNFYIKDKGGLEINDFKNNARELVRKKKVKAIFVDYLQLMKVNGKKNGTREQEVSHISHELKALALELEIPIVALSQLNRTSAGSQRLYQLSDLRESGAIEQDADNILFIFNPKKHPKTKIHNASGSEKVFGPNEVILQVEKCRLGDTGQVPLNFIGVAQRFEDFEEYSPMSINAPNNMRPLTQIEQTVSKALDNDFEEEDDNELPF